MKTESQKKRNGNLNRKNRKKISKFFQQQNDENWAAEIFSQDEKWNQLKRWWDRGWFDVNESNDAMIKLI